MSLHHLTAAGGRTMCGLDATGLRVLLPRHGSCDHCEDCTAAAQALVQEALAKVIPPTL